MTKHASPPASPTGRRRRLFTGTGLVLLLLGLAAATGVHAERRFVIAFANWTEEAGVRLEHTGFTGQEIRESFVLASRHYPIDLVLYDNQRDPTRIVANAADAIAKKVDLFVEYSHDVAANAAVADRLRAAKIPVLAINGEVPGAPLYTLDNVEAGRVAGDALGRFARAWHGQPMIGVLVGDLGAQSERTRGVREGLSHHVAVRLVSVDTRGNPAQVAPLLGKVLTANPGKKILVAAMDDATALASKSTLESAGRVQDAAIVSHGADRSIHGGINDRKEIDPANRGSIVIGSVGFFLDRYGYDVLPLALRMLRGEPVPARTATRHVLITPGNVFKEYPPYDMN